MRVPILILQEKVSEKWLEKCHERIEDQLFYSNEYLQVYHHDKLGDITSATFILDSYADINPKVVGLVQLILERFEVVGVWKEIFIKDTTEVVIGLVIYGHTLDIKFAINMLSYLLNGFDRYYNRHVKELRYKRMLRRARKTKLPVEVDARKRTNQNIAVKIQKLCVILYDKRLKPNKVKVDNIIKHVMAHEKLDHRKFRNMKNITLRAVKSRLGLIQLNRII